MNFMQLKQQNVRFLEAIRKNRASWEHDKKFAKIVKKMETGKNLKRKEFDKIYWTLWETGH